MLLKFSGDLSFGKGVHLLDKRDGDIVDSFLFAFYAQLVANLARAQQNAAGIVDLGIGTHTKEIAVGKFFNRR